MRSRSTRPTRAAAVVVVLLSFLGTSLFVLASPASAASSLVPKASAIGTNVEGYWQGAIRNYWAGLIGVDTDGDDEIDAYAYCIDLATYLEFDQVHDEGTWDASGVANLGQITWILGNYPASSATSPTTAAAVQAAIWHFTDGFELSTTDTSNSDEVIALYQSILADAEAVLEPDPTIEMVPGVGIADAGTGLLVDVYTTAPGPVALSLSDAPAGARIVAAPDDVCDLDGPSVTEVAANGQVCVVSPVVGGPAVLHAEVSGAVAAGRVFLRDGSQELIFAGGGLVTATADIEVSWVAPTTTTTEPPTTSTTTPPTTPTTEAEVVGTVQTTPDTAAEVLGSVQVEGELPYTGTDSSGLAVVGLAVVAGGAVLVLVARSRAARLTER